MACKHQKRALSAAIATITLNLSGLTHAADEHEPLSVEEVQVWGTEVKASNLTLDAESIAIKQADHLSDLIRIIPGVDLGGAHSLNQRITIRSLDDKDLRVSIDGANQNTYMFHHMGNLQIHADILKSADIQVGNNSVINGGLGGVARFKTRSASDLLRQDQRFGFRLNSSVSSNGYNSASLTGYGEAGQLDYLAYVNAVQTNDFEVGGGEIKDHYGEVVDGTDGTVRGLEGDVLDALLKVGFNLSDNQRIKIGYESYVDEGDYSARPDMGLATDIAMTNAISEAYGTDAPLLWPTEFTRDTLTLNYDAQLGNTTIELALFANNSTLERDESAWGDPVTMQEGEAKNLGINALFTTRVSSRNVEQELTYGLDVIHYDTHFATLNDSGELVDWDGLAISAQGEDAQSEAVFVQNKITFADKFSVTPGARFERWNTNSNLVNKRFEEPTFALALDYQLSKNTTIHASSTQLFKGPELAEVFIGAGGDDVLNQDIKAETGTNTEFGLAHETDVFSVGFTAFETQIKDYIYDYIDYTLYEAPLPKDNIGDMRIRGIEAFWGVSFETFDALLTYSSADSKLSAAEEYLGMDYHHTNRDGSPVLDDEGNQVIEFQEGFDGARTDRTAGDTFSIELNYHPTENVQIHYDAMHVSSLPAGKDLDGAPVDNAKKGYNIHNISVRWNTPYEGLSLTAGVDNLFDEYYASQASRTGLSFHPRFQVELPLTDYEPGRNIKASVSYRY